MGHPVWLKSVNAYSFPDDYHSENEPYCGPAVELSKDIS